MDNIILTQKFEIKVIKDFTDLQLIEFVDILEQAETDIMVLIETAEASSENEKKQKYEKNLEFLRYNKNLFIQVIGERESLLKMPNQKIKAFLNN